MSGLKKFFTIILYSICFSTLGQTPGKLDSLLEALRNQSNDTLKAKTLLSISNVYSLTDAARSLVFSQRALKLSDSLHWNFGIAYSYFYIGSALYNEGKFSEALEFRIKELNKWKEQNSLNNVCIALGNIGIVYSNLKNDVEALKYYFSSLKLAKQIGNKFQMINTLCNIGSLYKDEGNYKKAFEYYSQSLKLSEKIGDSQSIAINQGNLASWYSDQNNYGKALELYLIALQIDEKAGDKARISAWLANIGDLYQQQSDSANLAGNVSLRESKNAKAIEYFLKAVKCSEEIGNIYLKSSAFGNIGNIYFSRNKLSEAENYLNKALEYAISINAVDLIMDDHERFYYLYKKKGLYDKALLHYEKYFTLKDSIENENNNKNLSELQMKYDVEKKEKENLVLQDENISRLLQLKNERFFRFVLILIFFILLVTVFLIIRQNKLRSRHIFMQFEQKLLRTQMNPHFIFNSLASIESFIHEHQPKEAANYLSHFSRLMRLILENSTSEYIALGKEIEILNYYLSLQKLRLDDNLTYTIEIDDEIIPEHIFIPPMLTQPFIENAIEHGFRGSKSEAKIEITFKISNDNLKVEIIDNGIGIEKAREQKNQHKKHKSLAIQITHERLALLNKSKKKKISFSMTDLSDENKEKTGTKIIFLLPLVQNLTKE